MAEIDAAAPEGTDVLVSRAGAAVAIKARQLLGGAYGRRVLVAAGKGNNGADGRIAATILERWGMRCQVVTPPEAIELVAQAPGTGSRGWNLVIDAAYGTGLRGSWGADRPPRAPVLAVDIPSGIDALTGEDHGCWPAQASMTFGALKPGLLLHPGAAAAGELCLDPIGLDASRARAWLVTDADASAALPPAEPTAHKWRRAVRVIAGSPQMRGAGYLVCGAAQQAGAGMVVVSSPGMRAADVERPTEAVARELRPENWAQPALEDIERFHAAVIGPGLGTDTTASTQMARFISDCPIPLVIDADALGAVVDRPGCLKARSAPTVLTPHDGEFARLTGAPPAADRFDAVRGAAQALGAVVLLKGPTTLVAEPDLEAGRSRVLVVNSGTQRLATAGSGDVLAGVIAAVLSAGSPGQDPRQVATAVAAAAHWHGRTASCAADAGSVGSTPLAATDQIEMLAAARDEIGNAQPELHLP